MISCIDQGVKYTVRNATGKYGRPHVVNFSIEINLLANSMHNRLSLLYTTLLINCYHQKQGENEVSRSTVNLPFRRILPKIKNPENTTRNEE